MKIIHVTNAVGWSGGMKQISLLIPELQKAGHENILVCPPGCELIPKLSGCGARIVELPMFQDYDLIAAWKLRRLTAREKPDVVHTHHATAHAVTLLALTGFQGPALVVSRRVSFKPRKNPFSVWKYRSARIQKYSVVSGSVKDTLTQGGVDASKITVLYSAVNKDEFRADSAMVERLRSELKIPEGAPVFGKVANFSRWKGQHIFLEAAKQVLAQRPDAVFILAGKGTEQLKSQVESLGLQKSVRLLGFRKDVPVVVSLFTVSVNSAIEGEGLSGALRESLLLGVPIVGSDVSGNREIAQNGEAGFLTPVGDPEALARTLLHALSNLNEARAMAEKGRRWVLANATLGPMVENTLRLYRSALEAL